MWRHIPYGGAVAKGHAAAQLRKAAGNTDGDQQSGKGGGLAMTDLLTYLLWVCIILAASAVIGSLVGTAIRRMGNDDER